MQCQYMELRQHHAREMFQVFGIPRIIGVVDGTQFETEKLDVASVLPERFFNAAG